MQQNNYITSTCNDHDAVLSCRWQAEEDPTYALFEAALQGSSNRPTATSARDAKLQKAKGRVGFAHAHNVMQPRPAALLPQPTCWKWATADATQTINA